MTFSRCSGVLMHIASLPGRYGIGVLGQEACAYADFLRRAGQSLWQILPIGPTGFGNSPYQSYSSFAGNPNFIDPEWLAQQGYLTPEELEVAAYPGPAGAIDYAFVEESRRMLFGRAFPRFAAALPADYTTFCAEQAEWLEDYALFMAIKDAHGGLPYYRWEPDIRGREPRALAVWRQKCADGIAYHKMLQYVFYTQWAAVKSYANRQGIRIVGDIPIYVAPDSADVWAQPELFRRDGVAGCPPDLFSEDGQLWGNPLYNWEALRRTDYAFWVRRMRACLGLYDVVRIDHFRAFADYYCIPAGALNAREGHWEDGPGMDFFRALWRQLGDIPVIAEDLGALSPAVDSLLADSGLPGMKVLQFAFDPYGDSAHLPHHHVKNGVVYTGTHDNDTIRGWAERCPAEAEFARKYLRVPPHEELARPLMQAALASVADVCILTMQDLLGLGTEARMNTPATIGSNWRWRAENHTITPELAAWLADNSRLYRRIPKEICL